MSKGYVYILSNPAMPGLLKIGHSINGGRHRAAALFQTGIPTPFVLEFEILVSDAESTEYEVHNQLRSYRENKNREFFRCSVDMAIRWIVSYGLADRSMRLIHDYEYAAVEYIGYLASAIEAPSSDVAEALSYLNLDEARNAVSAYQYARDVLRAH